MPCGVRARALGNAGRRPAFHTSPTLGDIHTAMASTSRLPRLYEQEPARRLERVAEASGCSVGELVALTGGLDIATADKMVENVVGIAALPLGIATNFQVNGRDVLVPMAIEEPSVIAGASKAARAARAGGGFQAEADAAVMIAQVQLLDVPDPEGATADLLERQDEVLALANSRPSRIIELGGGARELEVRAFPDTPVGAMLVVHVLYDVVDAMGANAVNTAAEAVAPLLESITGGRANLRVLSNLADRRLARAKVSVPAGGLATGDLSGEAVAQRIVEAYALAAVDPYRAATHNKGIMNGIDAVAVATGNDWRAIEAGAHAFAARSGSYRPLSWWAVSAHGGLHGDLEMPLAVGTVGGATNVLPVARACLRLMGVGSARELASIMAAVGLAQNLAALWALATEGIQRGHMSLHARQVAMAAGAVGKEVETVAERLVQSGRIRGTDAERLLRETRDEPRGKQA